MTIIFDFNRTIYDPDTGALVPGALALLQNLSAIGHKLYLVSKFEAGREAALDELGIARYFEAASFVDDKRNAFEKIIRASAAPVFVIGDHLHGEIRIGNSLGAKTIWLRRGRFAHLTPEEKDDEPWRVIDDLMQAEELIV